MNTTTKSSVGAKTLKSENTTKNTTKSAKVSETKKDKGSSLSLKTLQVAELFTSIESKREFAKLGMSASLLTCVGSAFFKGNFARNLHIASGVALVGFSIWHHSLYDKNK